MRSPDDFVYPQMRARQAPRLFCGFVLVVGVCVVCVGPLGAACVVLGSWFCGFGVGVVGLVGSPCDGFCMVCVGIVVVGVMFENSTVCL